MGTRHPPPEYRSIADIEDTSSLLTRKRPLPPELADDRVLDAQQAAEFVGLSVVHWRRLCRAGKAPRPIKIGDRKLGWIVRPLKYWLETRQTR